MTIYQYKEDGSLHTGESIDRDNKDAYDILSPKEVLDLIDKAAFWDDIDPDIYAALCDELDIDMDAYDDPDKLFDVMKAKCDLIEE